MKTLFVSPFRDSTGYSHKGIDFILAMDAAGINIVPRCMKFNNVVPQLPERIIELENQPSRGCDIVVQHTLPHLMEKTPLYNIGMYASETTKLPTCWVNRLNLMDQIWVFNEQMQEAAINSGVETPIKVIYPPTNVDKYFQSYPKLFTANVFVFYTIIDFNRRKNLASLVKAFHCEFKPNEPVELVIKVSKSGLSPQKCREFINNLILQVKQGLKLYTDVNEYKQERVITDFLTEEQINGLHQSCDCFVLPSRGEGWSIPTFDSLGFGRSPIVSNCTGFASYIDNDCGWLVNGQWDYCFGENETFPFLYTANEQWFEVSVPHLTQCMREAYENKQLKEQKAQNGINRINNFSYQTVGQNIKKILDESVK